MFFIGSVFRATPPPRDSLSSRGLIRASRRVGFAMNSSDSMKAILYFALGGLDSIKDHFLQEVRGYPLCL